jgi:hypothetical protein
MPRDEDKSTIDERLTGQRDPKDPDGLFTIDDAAQPHDEILADMQRYGHAESDTLERERERERRESSDS